MSPTTPTSPNELLAAARAHASLRATMWSWLAALSLTSAAGVAVVVLGYNAGRSSAPNADLFFWTGLLILVLPVSLRLCSAAATRGERVALLVLLGMAFYLLKVLQYPLYFAYYDEFSHWRTTYDVLTSAHLFHASPLSPISPWYPGLEIVTAAVSRLTALSIFDAVALVIGAARLLIVLALYLFYECVSQSARIASIAVLLYMANPGFLFGDASFSYESFALPLAAFVLFVVAYRGRASARGRLALTCILWLSLGAVAISHHLTSYILVAILLTWMIVWLVLLLLLRRPLPLWPAEAGIIGLVMVSGWYVFTGGIARTYLGSHVTEAVVQLVQEAFRQMPVRQMFRDGSGAQTPLWERLTAYASIVLIVLGLPFGLFAVWRRYRLNTAAIALALTAVAYPLSQALRLAPAGVESADRATEFVFIGIGFTLAVGCVHFGIPRTPVWTRALVTAGVISVLFVGQAVAGNGPPWASMPGPYLVAADQRSIEPESTAAATWALAYLGPRHTMATDRTNALLMAAYGDEWLAAPQGADTSLPLIFMAPRFGPGVQSALRDDQVQYVVVDRRLSTGLPRVGTYFNRPVSNTQRVSQPISPIALAKFDTVPEVSRIYDSGDIVIYDVSPITVAPDSAPAAAPFVVPFVPAGPAASLSALPQRILGLFLIILLGLMLGTALLPMAIGVVERACISLSLSLVAVALGGLALNVLPSGMTTISWQVLLGGMTIGASMVTLWRMQATLPSRLPIIDIGFDAGSLRWDSTRLWKGALLFCAALLLGGAVVSSRHSAQTQHYPGFSQLWILPAGGQDTHGFILARIGMQNRDAVARTFRVVATLDIASSSHTITESWSAVHLAPGQGWQANVTWARSGSSSPTQVQVSVYRADAASIIYRQVKLTFSTVFDAHASPDSAGQPLVVGVGTQPTHAQRREFAKT